MTGQIVLLKKLVAHVRYDAEIRASCIKQALPVKSCQVMVLANTYALLTKAEIETAVVAYWKALSAKNAVQQQNFYDDQAGMFSTESKKLERAPLVLLRPHPEYLTPATST